jgi:hypothetical protein
MGKVGKIAKEGLKISSGYSLAKGFKDMMTPPDIPAPPKPPTPVAPTQKESDNVQQAKSNQRRLIAGRTGRSQSNILNPTEARTDDDKDLLG